MRAAIYARMSTESDPIVAWWLCSRVHRAPEVTE